MRAGGGDVCTGTLMDDCAVKWWWTGQFSSLSLILVPFCALLRAPLASRPELGDGGNLRPVVDLLVEQVLGGER